LLGHNAFVLAALQVRHAGEICHPEPREPFRASGRFRSLHDLHCEFAMASRLQLVARQSAVITTIALAIVGAAALLWAASSAILIVLIGIILAVAFDAGVRGLGHVVTWPRWLRLMIVFVASAAFVLSAAYWSGATVVQQAGQFAGSMHTMWQWFTDFVANGGLGPLADRSTDLTAMLPSTEALFGGATRALTSSIGVLTTIVAILLIGAFFAWDPQSYVRASLSLVPRNQRKRLSEVMSASAEAIRLWLLGQTISMAAIFTVSLISLTLVGMPFPALLAFTAGLLTFIPTIGPFIAGIIIVLAGLSVSLAMATYGLAIYAVIQVIESNVLTPLVQKETVHLPPAFTLAIQLIAASLLGLLGLAFSIPLAVAAKVFIEQLYVQDQLGGTWNEADE
jgi:predicted PurR-regulated permease PerM